MQESHEANWGSASRPSSIARARRSGGGRGRMKMRGPPTSAVTTRPHCCSCARLADQGVAKAQYQLAEMVPSWRRLPARRRPRPSNGIYMSAERDFPHAQLPWAFIYMNAIGVAKDYVQALKWFRLCQRHVGFAYSAGKNADLITPKMAHHRSLRHRSLRASGNRRSSKGCPPRLDAARIGEPRSQRNL